MRYFEIAPSAPLADFVQCLWYLEKDYGPPHPDGEWIFPDGTTDLVMQRQGSFFTSAGSLPACFFVGPRRTPLLLRAPGPAAAIGIRFHPHGVYPFVRQPLDEFTESIISLHDFEGTLATLPAEQCRTLTPLAAITRLERFLQRSRSADLSEHARLHSCVQWLRQSQGVASIAALADTVNLSTRQLERRFRQTIGVSPKQLARIIRFDAVRDQLMLHPGVDLTALAHSAWYHDQAHFIHDFRDLAGLAPTGFSREVAAGSIRFNS